eukprot:174387_1
MSAFHKQQASKDCLYHLYIEGVGDIQYSLKVPHPFKQTLREIICRALIDISNLRPRSTKDEKVIATYHKYHSLSRNFPQQYLNSGTRFYPNFYLKIGPKMVDPDKEDIQSMVDDLLRQGHNSISLNAPFISHQPKCNESLFIIVLTTSRYPLSSMSTSTTNSTPDNTHINQHNDQKNTHTNTTKSKIKSKTRVKKSSKSNTKPNKKSLKKKAPKRKRKSKKKKRHKKRHKTHSDSDILEDDKEYEFSDEEYIYSESSDNDLTDYDSDDFIPPFKKKKIDLKEVKNKLSHKNPRSMIRNNGPIIRRNYGAKGPIISRHRQFSRAPRLSIDVRARKQRLKRHEAKPNHLVILLDVSRSMMSNLTYKYYEDDESISRYGMALKYIRRYIQQQWKKAEQKQTLISFATFGAGLNVGANTLKYSATNVKKMVKILIELKKKIEGVLDDFEYETALYDCLLKLLVDLKENKLKNYKNTRILMFTDGENRESEPKMNDIKNALQRKKITVDCVQCSRSERVDTKLRNVCTVYSHQGRYWNPLTIQDWDDIFESIDFVYPYRRGFVYDLTKSDDESSDEED